MNAVTAKGRVCPDCDQKVRVKKDGGLWKHACHPPLPADATDTDAWDNPSRPHHWNEPAAVVEIRIPAEPGPMPTPDEFMSPAAVAEDEPKLNVSGQPDARRDWQKRYILVDPEAGDFRRAKGNGNPQGITRATTFNKAASSSLSLGDWKARNVVIGASRSPDILLRAHGLTHDTGKPQLNRIVDELEEVAGAKVGSQLGSYLHSFTELMDVGLKTYEDAPPQFQRSLALYAKALADAGLEPVPGLIERTTFISEFGGVAGTFDRVFYHRPSGTYVIGDLKTGKTMSYAMNETETQEWIYAHGFNTYGVYDWNTDRWDEWTLADANGRIKVSETNGVIIWMPVQGEHAGTVKLLHADLEAGRRHAELCDRVRSQPKSKVRAWAPPGGVRTPVGEVVEAEVVYDSDDALELPAAPKGRVWEGDFAAVTDGAHAGALWNEARLAGVDPMRLQDLVAIARETLLSRVDTPA